MSQNFAEGLCLPISEDADSCCAGDLSPLIQQWQGDPGAIATLLAGNLQAHAALRAAELQAEQAAQATLVGGVSAVAVFVAAILAYVATRRSSKETLADARRQRLVRIKAYAIHARGQLASLRLVADGMKMRLEERTRAVSDVSLAGVDLETVEIEMDADLMSANWETQSLLGDDFILKLQDLRSLIKNWNGNFGRRRIRASDADPLNRTTPDHSHSPALSSALRVLLEVCSLCEALEQICRSKIDPA